MSIEVGRIGELGQKNTDTEGAVSVGVSKRSKLKFITHKRKI